MNTVKKISTLFALALISQSSFATRTLSGTNTTSNPGAAFSGMSVRVPGNVAYNPTDSQIDTGDNGHIRSSMQNVLQSAYATNTADVTNNTNITGMNGSDLSNSMTVNTNAMNSSAGSSYNDSTNNITTNTTNNSTNDYTSTLDNSKNVTQPGFLM
jgi:hypothetical protein